MKCWQVQYYFTSGHKRRLLKGVICGCQAAETREAALLLVDQSHRQPGCTLVKVTAKKPPASHFCFTQVGCET